MRGEQTGAELAQTLGEPQHADRSPDPPTPTRARGGDPLTARSSAELRGAETGPSILLIEDDQAVADVLVELLKAAGNSVWHAATGAAGEALFDQLVPDLVILDLMLPDTDGLVLCAKLQERNKVPIIILSGTRRHRDAILALRLGADDFISKPFDIDELEARVQAVLRRSTGARRAGAAPREGQVLRVGQLVIDEARRRVTLADRLLQLTPTEHKLLTVLATRLGETVTREELARLVSGFEGTDVGRMVDVHVSRLRAKLNAGPVPAPPIVSVRAAGYKMLRPQPALGTTPL